LVSGKLVYEEVINNIKPDEAALKALIARITKSRTMQIKN
jgi:hypothetical protein